MTPRRPALPVRGVLAVTVAAEAVVLVGGPHVSGWTGLGLVLVAGGGWALSAWDERADDRPRAVMAAIAVALVLAVVMPPRQSHDLWSYAAYGRMVSVHHVSPYAHAPQDFPHDVFLPRVGRGWRDARSVYGPLFTGASAGLTRVTGTSALRTRLAFQGLAALAAALALALVWHATRRARALAFFGLHPVLVLSVVNGGHNDALVGLAVLAAVLLATRRRWTASGVVLGLGVLVKASTGLGLLGIAVWAFTRDRRAAARVVVAAAAVAVAGYLPAGVVALRALSHAATGNTRASVWDGISAAFHPSLDAALVLTLALAGFTAAAYDRRSRPTESAVASTAAFLLAGAYVLPSYAVWALPGAALRHRSKLAALVGVHAVFLAAVYEFEPPAHPRMSGFSAVARTAVVQIGAWSALVVFVMVLAGARASVRSAASAPRQPGESRTRAR